MRRAGVAFYGREPLRALARAVTLSGARARSEMVKATPYFYWSATVFSPAVSKTSSTFH
jgi:hypothetical protein